MKLVGPCLLLLTCFLTIANAAIEAVQFDDPAHQQRYQNIVSELRCLVCQNQNLADSDAGLAKDLRRKTAEMLRAGQTDEEIIDYMRQRYGDFVLYRPPLSLATSLIWLGPFVLLTIALVVVLMRVKRRQRSTALPADEASRRRVRKLLEESADLNASNDSQAE